MLLFCCAYIAISIKDKFHFSIAMTLTMALVSLLTFKKPGYIGQNKPINLIVWNIQNGNFNPETLLNFIKINPSKIYAFVEFDGIIKEAAEKEDFRKKLFPLKIKTLPHNMAIIYQSNQQLEILSSVYEPTHRINFLKIDSQNIALVDITPSPWRDRKPAFDYLNSVSDHQDIICGDFNTPYNSIHYENLLEKFNCGISKNNYHRETWPSYFPLLSLDHILISKKYTILSYHKITDYTSDHFPICISFKNTPQK